MIERTPANASSGTSRPPLRSHRERGCTRRACAGVAAEHLWQLVAVLLVVAKDAGRLPWTRTGAGVGSVPGDRPQVPAAIGNWPPAAFFPRTVDDAGMVRLKLGR